MNGASFKDSKYPFTKFAVSGPCQMMISVNGLPTSPAIKIIVVKDEINGVNAPTLVSFQN